MVLFAKITNGYGTYERMNISVDGDLVICVALVSLVLTWSYFTPFYSVSIAGLEQVNFSGIHLHILTHKYITLNLMKQNSDFEN